jgi:hypothetical protein
VFQIGGNVMLGTFSPGAGNDNPWEWGPGISQMWRVNKVLYKHEINLVPPHHL